MIFFFFFKSLFTVPCLLMWCSLSVVCLQRFPKPGIEKMGFASVRYLGALRLGYSKNSPQAGKGACQKCSISGPYQYFTENLHFNELSRSFSGRLNMEQPCIKKLTRFGKLWLKVSQIIQIVEISDFSEYDQKSWPRMYRFSDTGLFIFSFSPLVTPCVLSAQQQNDLAVGWLRHRSGHLSSQGIYSPEWCFLCFVLVIKTKI